VRLEGDHQPGRLQALVVEAEAAVAAGHAPCLLIARRAFFVVRPALGGRLRAPVCCR
jgi:hypothetical protein